MGKCTKWLGSGSVAAGSVSDSPFSVAFSMRVVGSSPPYLQPNENPVYLSQLSGLGRLTHNSPQIKYGLRLNPGPPAWRCNYTTAANLFAMRKYTNRKYRQTAYSGSDLFYFSNRATYRTTTINLRSACDVLPTSSPNLV